MKKSSSQIKRERKEKALSFLELKQLYFRSKHLPIIENRKFRFQSTNLLTPEKKNISLIH